MGTNESGCQYKYKYKSACPQYRYMSDEDRKTYCDDWHNSHRCATYWVNFDQGKINPDVTPYGCQFKDRCEKDGKTYGKYGLRINCWQGNQYEECPEYSENIKKLGCEHKNKCSKYTKLRSFEKEHLCYRNQDYYEKCPEYANYCKQYGCEYKNKCEEYKEWDERSSMNRCHKAHRYKKCSYRQKIAEKKAQQKATMLERIKKGGILVATAAIISIILALLGII